MKKILTGLMILFLAAAGAVGWHFFNSAEKKTTVPTITENGQQTIYLNVNDIKISSLFIDAQKLAQAIKYAGKGVVLSGKGDFKTGNFNLYLANDINHLPEVEDNKAINILWLPTVSSTDGPERLRAFDVITVKSMAAFGYLKAINVRTAFIPEAIEMKRAANRKPNGKAMFYGDNQGISLPLYMAGRNDISVDIYGKGFETNWPLDEIKGDMPETGDFSRYSVVLLDQSDEAVRDELVEKKIIEAIENGGLPFLRFNSGVYKLFGEALPMYHNEPEFIAGLQELKDNPEIVRRLRAKLQQASQAWNRETQALKFIELFELMEKKRR